VFSRLGEGSLVLACLDGFTVQEAVAAAGALPQAGGAQLVRGDRGLKT
jgi:hypothetical protein